MYQKKSKQLSFDENPHSFIGVRLNPENRWVKLAEVIPWDKLEGHYHQTFANPEVGNPAKSCRMAIGSLIIKEKMGLSDIETVEMIAEHPYLQYFIGLHSFTDRAPFDASTMTYFRKRLSAEILAEINQMVVEAGQKADEENGHDDDGEYGTGSADNDDAEKAEEENNRGTLILDATCAPADIHFPTDVSLLNESRLKLEGMIDTLNEGAEGAKPRTYRQKARQSYLRFARNRRPRGKQIRKAIREQLGYVRRDLGYVSDLLSRTTSKLTPRQQAYYETIQEVYRQQQEMFERKTHKVANRIVSIHQPWVRPIVRGKANANVEFGAKISVSMIDGYAIIERLEWDSFNEAGDLKLAAERFKQRHGFYPKKILADMIYRNRDNRKFCKERGIQLNGPQLGRPPKDKELYAQQKQAEKQDAGERNAIEGKFGEGKRCYGLSRVMARLKNTSEVSIHMTFLVMNLEKRLRDLCFNFIHWMFAEQLVFS